MCKLDNDAKIIIIKKIVWWSDKHVAINAKCMWLDAYSRVKIPIMQNKQTKSKKKVLL